MSENFVPSAEGSEANNSLPHELLPRPKKVRRRDRADRGLPPDAELQALAAEYLRVQQKLWPSLMATGIISETSEAVLAEMVDRFKDRHRGGTVAVEDMERVRKLGIKLGGSYNRFSCDNSNPKSISDQMTNALEKAKQENRFVPWSFVFADYSVTGLTPSRQGYSSYKNALASTTFGIETTYIDDFTRASRDEIEWWKLAHLSRRLGKRLIGASDGFDLSSPHAEEMIALYGLVSRLHIKGLREKVRRGMRGSARRGGCMGKLPLGFTRTARRNEKGEIVRDPNGLPQYVPAIDPESAAHLKLMYELFVNKSLSFYKIAQHFNALQIEGWTGWNVSGIKKMLWSASALGVFFWDRNRHEYDHERERMVEVPNPRKHWILYYDPKLAIVPLNRCSAERQCSCGLIHVI